MTEWILSSSVLILVVIGLRTLLKGKISLRLQYALWALVLLRLLIPLNFGASSLSTANLADSAREQPVVRTVMDIGSLNIPVQSYENAYREVVAHYESQGIDVNTLHGSELEALEYEAYDRMQGADLGTVLYLTGMILVGAAFFVTNLHFRKKIMASREPMYREKDGLSVYVTDRIDTPCLFGLWKPAIYVTYPVADDATLLRHTLEHEAIHYRHLDHIWAVLRCQCLALHWYNPLVWWAAFLSRQDGELACDEATIKRLGEGERVEYGRTLIGMTCRKKANVLVTATTMNSGKHSLKERILLIARKPKMAVYTMIAVVLIAAVAVGCTFTGARLDRQDILQELPDFLEEYCYEQVKDRMDREEVQYLGSVNECSLVYCSGTGPQLVVLRHEIKGDQIIVTDQAEGEYVITGGLSVNHLVDGDKHIYFGLISDSYWGPESDELTPLDWKDLVMWDTEGIQKIVNFGDKGYIVELDTPISDFWVVLNGGDVALKMEDYLAWGYEIHQCSWNSEGKEHLTTEPTQIPVESAPVPTEMPDNAPPVSLPDTLHREPDPDKICIAVMPTAYATSGEDWYYIIPENQELLMEYYQKAAAKATKLSWDNNIKSLGWKILYQDEWWIVKENGAILCDIYGDNSISSEGAKDLFVFCRDAVQEAGIGDPVRPEDISGITSATLHWNGTHTVTQPYILARIEELFSNRQDKGSVQCWMDARLELTLENGETLVLAIATDDCASWMSEGVAYGYGEVTNVGIAGNEEFYSFFMTDIIHEKAQEGPDAMASYWPYVHWGEYSRKYGHEEAFSLLYMFEEYLLANPTDWNIYVALTTVRSADGAYAEFCSYLICELFEAAPDTFSFACRQMVPEQYVEFAVYALASYWEITPEEARARLEAAQAS